jgi:hypothetical protein
VVKKFLIATVAAFALATSALAQSLQGAVQQNTIDEMLEQRWQLHLCFPRLGASTICAPIGVPHQLERACAADLEDRADQPLPQDAWLSCHSILAPNQ